MLLQPAFSSGFGRLSQTKSNGVCVYQCEELGRTHYMFFADGEQEIWNSCRISSDARFLYCCIEEERVTRFVLHQGRFARLGAKLLVSHDREIERLEWSNSEGSSKIFSSDQLPVSSFCEVVSNLSE